MSTRRKSSRLLSNRLTSRKKNDEEKENVAQEEDEVVPCSQEADETVTPWTPDPELMAAVEELIEKYNAFMKNAPLILPEPGNTPIRTEYRRLFQAAMAAERLFTRVRTTVAELEQLNRLRERSESNMSFISFRLSELVDALREKTLPFAFDDAAQREAAEIQHLRYEQLCLEHDSEDSNMLSALGIDPDSSCDMDLGDDVCALAAGSSTSASTLSPCLDMIKGKPLNQVAFDNAAKLYDRKKEILSLMETDKRREKEVERQLAVTKRAFLARRKAVKQFASVVDEVMKTASWQTYVLESKDSKPKLESTVAEQPHLER